MIRIQVSFVNAVPLYTPIINAVGICMPAALLADGVPPERLLIGK